MEKFDEVTNTLARIQETMLQRELQPQKPVVSSLPIQPNITVTLTKREVQELVINQLRHMQAGRIMPNKR